MNKILKLTLILFLVCAIVAGVLGFVNMITKDRIAEQNAAKTKAAYAAVLEAPDYSDVSFDSAAYPTIDSISKASDGSGYVVMTTFSGAQGSIQMCVGVKQNDNKFLCSGISIISHSETSGLGAVAASTGEAGKSFRSSFLNKGKDITVKDIDAITGATITSKAITGAVSTAIQAVEDIA